MIHAYDKVYLDKARTVLGRMLDFAAYDLNYDIADFFQKFICSGVAARFEIGDFTVITGRSGVELAMRSWSNLALSQNVSSQIIRQTAVRNFGWAGHWRIISGRLP